MPKKVKEAYDKMHDYFKSEEFKRKMKQKLPYWFRDRREKKCHITGNMEK